MSHEPLSPSSFLFNDLGTIGLNPIGLGDDAMLPPLGDDNSSALTVDAEQELLMDDMPAAAFAHNPNFGMTLSFDKDPSTPTMDEFDPFTMALERASMPQESSAAAMAAAAAAAAAAGAVQSPTSSMTDLDSVSSVRSPVSEVDNTMEERADPAGSGDDAVSGEGAPSPRAAQKRSSVRRLTVEEYRQRQSERNEREAANRRVEKEQFVKLQDLLQPKKRTKAVILEAALEKLREQEQVMHRLESELAEAEAQRHAKRSQAEMSGVEAATSEAEVAASTFAHITRPEDYRRLFNQSGAAMFVTMLDGQIVDVNPKFESLMKNSRAMLTNLSVFTITHPAFAPIKYGTVSKLASGASDYENEEIVVVDCQGDPVSVHVTTWIVREPGEKPKMMAVILPVEAAKKPQKRTKSS